MISTLPSGTSWTKGHGTQNDFVLLPDPDGNLNLERDGVAALADRRGGIGADGVIRVVRSEQSGIAGAVDQAAAGAEWFMDYYNSDGSLSEMCGNGVRVFAHYLLESGLVDAAASEIKVGTRDGIKTVTRVEDPWGDGSQAWYSIDMGQWRLATVPRDGADSVVDIAGVEVARPGLSIDTGNPHTVVALAGRDELAAADLHSAPRVDPVPPYGSNVELIVMEGDAGLNEAGVGALLMRVHERGVGETRSCGTGACAAALAARYWAGAGAPDVWRVEVPGGTLRITTGPQTVTLAGPATLVANGTLV